MDSSEVDVMKCTKYESWLGVGLKVLFLSTMTANITKFILRIQGTLKFCSGDTVLAKVLLDTVESQYSKLTMFVAKFYKELTTVANFPKESPWPLIESCAGGFFQTMVTI